MNKHTTRFLAGLAAAILLFCAGCGQSGQSQDGGNQAAGDTDASQAQSQSTSKTPMSIGGSNPGGTAYIISTAYADVINANVPYGKCWLQVPETILVRFTGRPAPNVQSKDLALAMLGRLTQAGAVYRCLEFEGEALQFLSVESRAVISNMAIEAGAKSAVMPCDQVLTQWLHDRGIKDCNPTAADGEAVYCQVLEIDASALSPIVAPPSEIDGGVPVDTFAGVPVDQVFIGSCTNGRYEDFALAASILKGKRVAPGVRLLICPASAQVAFEMSQSGVYQTLLEAGAVMLPPSCSACSGMHGGLIADGETVLSTTNRNMPGRMGSTSGKVYIASPLVAAYTALTGTISSGGGTACD